MKRERKTAWIEKDLLIEIKILSARYDIPVQDIINGILDEHLKQLDGDRPSLRPDAATPSDE